MSDIVERLADLIADLRVENYALSKSCAASAANNDLLRAEVERLRAALERLLRAKNEKDAYGDTPVYQALKAGAWDEARAALTQETSDE
jgi:hypothetical protein